MERGHQDVVAAVQCVAYTLGQGGLTEHQARTKLEAAVARIKQPVRVMFGDQVSTLKDQLF